MKQKLNAILDDDRGVSPVIGVILMVAITVILAAVIGTFVLGLGDSLQQAPSAQLSAEVVDSGSNQVLEISHNGGDSIPADELRVSLNGDNSDTIDIDSDNLDSNSEFSVGGTLTIDNGEPGNDLDTFGETEVRVIHVPSESIILDTEVTFDS